MPPLWFAEGMAEYLSLGPSGATTNAWMRDAALNGRIPSIEQLGGQPDRYFPYRYGHSLWTFIGQKWGDEAIGQILNSVPSVGVERAFRRELGKRKQVLLDAIASESKIDAIRTELELHGTVFEYCDNELLMTMWRGLSGRLQLYWALQQEVHGRKGARTDAHDDYVALAQGDDLNAMKAELSDHMQRGLTNVLASLKQAKAKAA